MWDGLILELDLCILAYQLHSQSLIWPTDPYCEQLLKHKKDEGRRRQEFAAEVTKTFSRPFLGGQAVPPPNANADYHGPGACMGWQETNSTLDPIISEYDRIDPWQPCFVRPLRHREPWLVYQAPTEITSKIGRVVVVSYDPYPGPYNPAPIFQVDDLTGGQQPRLNPPQNAPDWLYCFEGGTGGDPRKDSDKKYALWGLMGFVLATHRATAPPPHYDVHIVFRGSRSGKLRPAEAMSKKGNPDWVTDLMVLSMHDERAISQTGQVSAGFAESQKRILPTVMECLDRIHKQKNGAPHRIFVSGHSLGGALACHFASAVTLGNSYAYTKAQGAMPTDVQTWPWATMTVTTFGAPAMGDAAFMKAFDAAVRSCTRVWVLADPITAVSPWHVGTSLCLTPPATDHLTPGERHDPVTIRKYLGEEYQKQIRFYPNTFYAPPATTNPPTDPRRPWAYFTSCSAMLAHLTAVPGYTPADVFQNFIPNLEAYLLILGRILSPRSQQAQRAAIDLAQIVTALKQPQSATYYTDVETAWSQAAQLQAYDAGLHGYVGICLYLAAVTNGQAPLQPPPGPLAAVLNTQ